MEKIQLDNFRGLSKTNIVKLASARVTYALTIRTGASVGLKGASTRLKGASTRLTGASVKLRGASVRLTGASARVTRA